MQMSQGDGSESMAHSVGRAGLTGGCNVATEASRWIRLDWPWPLVHQYNFLQSTQLPQGATIMTLVLLEIVFKHRLCACDDSFCLPGRFVRSFMVGTTQVLDL